MNTNIKLYRTLLLVFGCLPMIAIYGMLSLGVLLFALPALFYGGNTLNIIFVIWWLLGTYALLALVSSCVNYRRCFTGPKRWQQIGLLVGALLTIPLVALEFIHGLEKAAAVLGAVAAVIILVTDHRRESTNPENSNGRT